MTPLLPLTNIFAIEVPGDSCDHGIVHIYAGEDILYWYKNGESTGQHYGAVNIDGPDYTVVCASATATEEEAGKMVEKIFDCEGRPGYKHYHSEDHVFAKAISALHSLLRANGLTPEKNNYAILKHMIQ